MSGLTVLLLSAAASAYGAWASLRSRPPFAAAAIAALLFAAAGLVAVLATWIAGDGIVLPGRQVSPGLVGYYLSEELLHKVPPIGGLLVLLGPVGHLLLLAVRRDKAALLRPLPATAAFVWLFLGIGNEGRLAVVQARGPDKVAYLTVASREGGTRFIIAAGEPMAAFLKVLHVADAKGMPPGLHVYWTKDGKAVVVRLEDEKDAVFAVDLDGEVTGAMPEEPREWAAPGEFVPPDVSKRLSLARKEVFYLIQAHGGLMPP
ncbi:MAG TPA: hypothetical protein VFY93_13355 [Planctomycetota bacterium]|nr:hypothetical protein [Planctomycetota bacterium]